MEELWSLAAFAWGSDLLSPPVLSRELGLWQLLHFYFYWFPLSCSFQRIVGLQQLKTKMSPASPTPPPRAHGRVCVHECGGTLSTTMATTTATHPYLLMKRMHFSQLIPQTTRRHCFCPKPIQAHAEEKHTQEMSPRKLNFQGIIYLLVTKKGKGLSSGPLSPYIRVLPETHFSASLAALN